MWTGRKGWFSIFRLYYSYSDKSSLFPMFVGQPHFDAVAEDLNNLVEFLENPVHCRHREILAYFGERKEREKGELPLSRLL